ncbi:helix-turn-helix transcriptional regulator [Cupriavidus sp. BIS7]|uniref:helix-turn-helix domain-containing protein n=1 Tax=Cupriavidus sp. BIS7 TaxID=1217718 RepID=UPI0003624FC1|nr:helix-turn-helix transcriptional regulator [Cupriavidus sp. BIS7]
MTERKQLLTTLKIKLRERGVTYRDIAAALRLSEASVKRLFSTGNLSIDRLFDICGLLDMTLAELTQSAAASSQRLVCLDERLEAELVSDPKLLLVATCALNHWRLVDIIEHYQLDEAECLRYLLLLDRMRLIDLLPGNRIRINVARDFDWLPGGNIARFFAGRGRDDFLTAPFNGEAESLFFVHGMLTPDARRQFMAQLQKLRHQFSEFHEDCVRATIGERQGTAMLLAIREWEPPDFARLRRRTQ